jgi:hypothetical protein
MEKPKRISLVTDEQLLEERGEEDEMREAKLSNILSVCS